MANTINKQEIIAKYGRTPNDTGSPEVQIALLTARMGIGFAVVFVAVLISQIERRTEKDTVSS